MDAHAVADELAGLRARVDGEVAPELRPLLDGVAHVAARLRRRIEEEAPELAATVLHALWPALAQPAPASTVQVFAPHRASPAPVLVPAGTRVRAAPRAVREGGPPIAPSVVTTDDVVVPPLQVQAVRHAPGGRHGALVLTFAAHVPLDRLASCGTRVRVHVDDPDLDFACRVVRHLVHRPGAPAPWFEAHGRSVAAPPPSLVALDPAPSPFAGDTVGLGLLRRHALAPRSLLFVDLLDTSRVPPGPTPTFSLVVPLGAPFHDAARLAPHHFVLGATPAVDVFETTAAPIQRLPVRDAYPVRPSVRAHDGLEVLEVLDVVGHATGATSPVRYARRADAAGPDVPWYDVVVRRGAGQRSLTALALPPPARLDVDERITVRIRCSHGRLTSDLPAGALDTVVGGPPDVHTRNLRAPDPGAPTPLGTAAPWSVLGLLAAAHAPLTDAEALRRLLRATDPQVVPTEAHTRMRRCVDAVRRLQARSAFDRIEGRHLPGHVPAGVSVPVWGVDVTLDVDGAASGEGNLWLLGAVLDRFLAGWTPLTTRTRLVVRHADGRFPELAWPSRIGRHPLT